LGTVDEAIRVQEQVIAKTELLKQGLMQRLLTEGIGHTEYKQTPMGRIPKTWKIVKIKDIIHSLKNGVNYSKNDFGSGIKFVNVSDIFTDDYIDTQTLERIQLNEKQIERYALEDGDIIIIRSSLKKEGVAYPALFKKTSEPIVYCGFLIRLRPNQSLIDPYYLLLYLRLERTRNWLISGSGTVGITNVSQESVSPLPVILPPLEEQKHIIKSIQQIKKGLRQENEQVNDYQTMKQGLMQVLLSGERRVELREDGLHRI